MLLEQVAESHTRPRETSSGIISLRDVAKAYDTPAGLFEALHGISLDVARGEFVSIVGKSGSGKSTLLNLMAGIDRPTHGTIHVGETDINALSNRKLASFRGQYIGVVFQFFQLLPTLTVAENVILPMEFRGAPSRSERRDRALELLASVGIADQAEKFPLTLSGGQQQRAAIARALANQPAVLLADEPTGNLDSVTAQSIFDLFRRRAADGIAVVIATHERDIAGLTRTIELIDGKVSER